MIGISALNALNKAIYEKLAADEWLKTNNVSVYQSVEKENAYPYLVLGESTATIKNGSTYWEERQVLTFHVYSQKNSKYEANEIINRLLFLLQERFVLDHYIITDASVFNTQLFEDVDQFTKHGVVQMEYEIKNKVKYREE